MTSNVTNTDIYAAQLEQGRQLGEQRSETDWAAQLNTINVAVLAADEALQSPYSREAFEAAVHLYAQLVVLGTRMNDHPRLAIALHRIAHAYQYARTEPRDRNLHRAIQYYASAANSYSAAGDHEEAAACIGRAAGCVVDLRLRSNGHINQMLEILEHFDANKVSRARTKGNLIFNKAQLIGLMDSTYDTAPTRLRQSFEALIEAESLFAQDGDHREALITTQLARLLQTAHKAEVKAIRISAILHHLDELPVWLQRFMTDNIEHAWETLEINPQILGLDSIPSWVDKERERQEANRRLTTEIEIVRKKFQQSPTLVPVEGSEISLDPARLQASLEWTINNDITALTRLVDIVNGYNLYNDTEAYLSAAAEVVLPAATHLENSASTVHLLKSFATAYERVSDSLDGSEIDKLVRQSPVVLRFTSFALAAAGFPEDAVRVLNISRQIVLAKQFPNLGLRRRQRAAGRSDAFIYLISAPAGIALILKDSDSYHTRIINDASSRTLTVATSAETPGKEGLLVAQQRDLDDLGPSIERALQYCAPVARGIVGLAKEVSTESVTLLTTGTASVIPWGAVPVGDGQTLGESVGLSVSPFSLQTTESPAQVLTQAAHLFALPSGGAHTPLPGVASEIEVARKSLTAIGMSATSVDLNPAKSAVTDAFRAGGLVHIATHSGLDINAPLNSSISLADGELSALEILDIDCTKLELVILSSCESAKTNPFELPDDIIGLQTSLIYAGARRVVASLWPVSDSATLLLMSRFYYQLSDLTGLSTASVRTALASAQRWLRISTVGELRHYCRDTGVPENVVPDLFDERLDSANQLFASPYYWAAFCVMVRDLPLVNG